MKKTELQFNIDETDIVSESSEDIIEGEAVVEGEEASSSESIENIKLEIVVPLSAYIENINDNLVAYITFLAKTEDKLISISTSYQLENVNEVPVVESLPFNIQKNFPSNKIVSDLVSSYVENYVTDFVFNYYNDKEDRYKFDFKAKKLTENGLDKTVIFDVTSDVFNSIKYIDSYLFDGVVNNYELAVASTSGRSPEIPTSVIDIDRIDRVVAMSQIKDSDTTAIEYVMVDKDDNKYVMLSTFNLGVKFNRKKFKGMTIDKLQNNYLQESDQYLQLFNEFCRFGNIDKEYLIIKGRNKDEETKMFLLDSTVRTELQSMIGDY